MTKYFALFTLLALFASASSHWRLYKSMADLTPGQRLEFANIDGYYLGKAKEQAAFTLNCSPQELTISIVSTRLGERSMQASDGWWIDVEHGAEITTIGAEGCRQRASYQVLCGPGQDYTHVASRGKLPCDVIPSSEAGRVVNQNNQEQQRLNDEAAHQAAQQQSK